MANPVMDPSFKHFEEIMREYYGFVISSSSILISVPLIALSVLASLSSLPKSQLGVIAVLEVSSAILFSISLYLMLHSHFDLVRIWGIQSTLMMAVMMTPEQKAIAERSAGEPFFQNFEKDLPKLLESKKDINLAGWSIRFFLGGILFLIFSLLFLAYVFLS
jgi:hypothetical protein